MKAYTNSPAKKEKKQEVANDVGRKNKTSKNTVKKRK